MIRSLSTKLVVALLVILVCVGLVFIWLAKWSSDRYHQEITQRLNASIAMYIVNEEALLNADEVNTTALEVVYGIGNDNPIPEANYVADVGSCIVYTYDANLDGILDNNDIMGFRLNNGVVEMRQNGDVVNNAAHVSCTSANDTWIPVTDSRLVTVTQLDISLKDSECINTREPNSVDNDSDAATNDNAEMNCYDAAMVPAAGNITVETRNIEIALAGELASDATVNVQINQSIRVRNDLVRIR